MMMTHNQFDVLQGSSDISTPHTAVFQYSNFEQPLKKLPVYYSHHEGTNIMPSNLHDRHLPLSQKSTPSLISVNPKISKKPTVHHHPVVEGHSNNNHQDTPRYVEIITLDDDENDEVKRAVITSYPMDEGQVRIAKSLRALRIFAENTTKDIKHIDLPKAIQDRFQDLKSCILGKFKLGALKMDVELIETLEAKIGKAPVDLIFIFFAILILLDEEKNLMNNQSSLILKAWEFAEPQVEAWAMVEPKALVPSPYKLHTSSYKFKHPAGMFEYLYKLSNKTNISYSCLCSFIEDWLNWEHCPQHQLKENFTGEDLKIILQKVDQKVQNLNLNSRKSRMMNCDDLKRILNNNHPYIF